MNSDVLPTESPRICPYCEQPFPTEQIRCLHKERKHSSELSEEERLAARDAYDEETTKLRGFQLRALLGVVFLYFGFLFAYAIFA